MSSEVFEESLELEVDILEAGATDAASYPYPRLTPLGRAERRNFRAVVLENQYLRATFIPALGGRLLALLDKRTGKDVFAVSSLTTEAGGRRGAVLAAGLQLHLTGEDRLTAMGEVAYAAKEPAEEEPAVVWFAESVTGTGLSWHLRVELPPDACQLRLEARVFNRTLAEQPYCGGLMLPAIKAAAGPSLVAAHGLALFDEEWTWSLAMRANRLWLGRFAEPRMLAPRQLDTWRIVLTPVTAFDGMSAASLHCAMKAEGLRLSIQAHEPISGCKIIVLSSEGKTLETIADLVPETTWQADLVEPAARIVVLASDRRELLRWDGGALADVASASAIERRPAVTTDVAALSEKDLRARTFDVATRHAAFAALADQRIAAGDYDSADQLLEQSLLYNGDDHLGWWLKALAKRMGSEQEESPELLNAHYLAPLEPALRAEGFLSQPPSHDESPHPLLKPLGPEELIEVACLLLERALIDQAIRWMGEALRHCDPPMLRILLAYALLQSGRTDVDALREVRSASTSPPEPPYPFRAMEIRALARLVERFPAEAGPREYSDLARSAE